MVKLASARKSRLYGPRLTRNRWEYVNAGVYVFAVAVLIAGFAALLPGLSVTATHWGLVTLLISLALVAAVNVHDLVAHLAGFDFRLSLMELDPQLAFVELAVPFVQALASALMFLALLFIPLQADKGFGYNPILVRHAVNLLLAGPILWLLGSILNSCQVYERANGSLQILQQSVTIPFLAGSLLLVVGALHISRDPSLLLVVGALHISRDPSLIHHGVNSLGRTWVVFGICGGALLLIGGLLNVVKVYNMQQINCNWVRLEELRGGAQTVLDLLGGQEGGVPLVPDRSAPYHLRELFTPHPQSYIHALLSL